MRIIAIILTIALSFTLGGEQFLLTLGRNYSHSHATKMASYLAENSHKLFEQKISISDYQSIDFEYVGSNVFEYQSNGKMYDVFKVEFSGEYALMLVKEDKFESGIVAIQKLFKRKLRTTSERIENQIFNFYFFQNPFQIIKIKVYNLVRFSNDLNALRVLSIMLDCPPPESI